jgi:manganese-transporting P-type ATPase
MIFATERISANNAFSLVSIPFLLLFALASASYAWVVCLNECGLPKSKLLLDCVLIVTSVVPPELPASLAALWKYAVFVTKPTRIPDAGRVDVVCWDKTRTATRNEMVCEGVVVLVSEMRKLCEYIC